jgi:hypothetical protein
VARLWPFKPRPKHALPPPWHQRKVVWATGAALVVAGAVLLTSGGGGGDPFVEPDFNTTSSTSSTSSTTTAPVACIAVANPSLLFTIAATAASAVAIDDSSWFVAKANGATWLTTADPTRDAAGELLPMNDQARTDSASRRDVPADDPMYGGHRDDERAAEAARSCAGG